MSAHFLSLGETKYMLMLGVLYVEFVIEASGYVCYVPIRHY